MKKYVIALAILAVASVCGRALTLKEAFAALSEVPNISVVESSPSGLVGLPADSVGNLEMAVANNLDAARIKETGDAVYAVLDKVPLVNMINGANNHQVAAFLYATPNADGRYDFLVVSMGRSRRRRRLSLHDNYRGHQDNVSERPADNERRHADAHARCHWRRPLLQHNAQHPRLTFV